MIECHCHKCERMSSMTAVKGVGGRVSHRCNYCGYANETKNVVIIRDGAYTCLGCGRQGIQKVVA